MKNIKKLIAAVVISTIALGTAGCGIVEKTPESKAKQVVAKIGDKTITRGEIDKLVQSTVDQVKAQYGDNYATNAEAMATINDQKKSVLSTMIDTEVLLKYVTDKKVSIDQADISKQVESLYAADKKNYGSDDDAQFKTVLANAGYTPEQYKTQIKNSLITQKGVDYMTKDVTVKDTDVDSKMKTYKDQGARFIQYILIQNASTATDADKAKNKATAESVLKEIKGGLSFDDAAKKYSQDTSTNSTGGYLGVVTKDSQLVTEFLNAALALNPGQMSGVVTSPDYGYFIIRAYTDDEAKVKEKADLLSTAKNDKYTSTMTELRKEYVKEYDKNLTN